MARHAKLPSDVALAVIAGCEHGIGFAQIGGGDPFPPSADVATFPGSREARAGALPEQIALELTISAKVPKTSLPDELTHS
jgi:hypothetical protein